MNLASRSNPNLQSNSVTTINGDRRAIRVKFFRNGDKYYKGFDFPIAFIRYKQLGTLFKALNSSIFCDQKRLPHGIRYIFDLDGIMIKSIADLKDAGSYVCSSNSHFIPMDYLMDTRNPIWKTSSQNTRNTVVPVRPLVVKDKQPVKSLSVFSSSAHRLQSSTDVRLNEHRTIVVVKNGLTRPRKMFRWTFSLQPIPQFSILMNELCRLLDVPYIAHLCTIENNEINSLNEILKVETVFFAFSESPVNETDFLLTNQELTLINFMKEAKLKGSDSKIINKLHENKSRNSFDIPTKTYDIGAKIGSGSFSSVRECLNKKTNELVALKRIDMSRCKESGLKIKKEVEIMKQLTHPNIIKFIESFETEESLYLVLEYIPNSDLINTIIDSKYYSEQDIGGVIHNLVSAIQYIHSLEIIHRDIKIENVLVLKNKNGLRKLKLCDFGLAVKINPKKRISTVCGTPIYMAPEVILQKGYDQKVDVWAVGVFLHILIIGNPPFGCQTKDFNETFDIIVEGSYDKESPDWNKISPEAKNLIELLLNPEPTKRMTAEEVLNYPWVSSDKIASQVNLRSTVGPKLQGYYNNSSYYKNDGNGVIAKTVLDKDSNYFEMAPEDDESEIAGDH